VYPTIQIGPFTLHSYGVMMALAFLAGLWTASRRGLREGIPTEKIFDVGPWLIVGTILGARILYVTTYWREEFAGKPIGEIFMVWHGGLVFYGGLIGAIIGGILYARLKKLPLWKMADVLAPSIALGYVFGRIGCLLNGCCYGRVCNLPWAVRFPAGSFAWQQQVQNKLITQADAALPVHPTEVYESLLNLLLYFALAWLYRRKKFDGQVFAAYLMGYAVERSIVETFRGDYSALHLHGGFTPAHLISLGIFAAGAVLFVVQARLAPGKPKPAN
jgi:phosphatidylglycerol:prolipoprotein diacylglycerol transferase